MRSSHYSKRSEQTIRAQIAQEAARIIIEDGVLNYQTAKTKAAHRLGMSNTETRLPCNQDIDHEMQQYHLIYSGPEQLNQLLQQRTAALEAMQYLEQFSPRLTGPVLSGVAGQHSSVILHVFADTPEAIITTLLDAGIPFVEKSHEVTSPQGKLESFSRLCLLVDNITIELLLFPHHYLHNRTKTKGLLTKRATTRQVQRLLGQTIRKVNPLQPIQSA
ncbi:MAG TPA: hypothetical protein ENJ32_02580 [Crenotrichaceae bacterium]|nr:hypothetical protein [Crenotrichaceae bacterium]